MNSMIIIIDVNMKKFLQHVSTSKCARFDKYAKFLSCVVIMNGNWVHFYDLEIKQWSMEWGQTAFHKPQKFPIEKSTGKFVLLFFGFAKEYSWLISWTQIEP